MPAGKEGVKSGPESGGEKKEEAGGTWDERMLESDPAAFGVQPSDKDDPDKSPQGKKSDDPGKKEPSDPDKKGDEKTSAGTDKKPDADKSDQKYAGKYGSVPDLEEGYRNQSNLFNTVLTEKKALEEKHSDREYLQSRLAELDKELGKDGKTDTRDLFKTMAEDKNISAELDTLMETLGETETKALTAILGYLGTQNKQVNKDLAQKLELIQHDEAEKEFQEKHPESKEEKIAAGMDKVIKDMREKAQDPMFMRESILDIAKAKMIPDLIRQAVDKEAEKLAEEKIKTRLASGLLISSGPGGAPDAHGKERAELDKEWNVK